MKKSDPFGVDEKLDKLVDTIVEKYYANQQVTPLNRRMNIRDINESVRAFSDKEQWLNAVKEKYPNYKITRTTDANDLVQAFIYHRGEHQQVGYWDPLFGDGEVWSEMDLVKRNNTFTEKSK